MDTVIKRSHYHFGKSYHALPRLRWLARRIRHLEQIEDTAYCSQLVAEILRDLERLPASLRQRRIIYPHDLFSALRRNGWQEVSGGYENASKPPASSEALIEQSRQTYDSLFEVARIIAALSKVALEQARVMKMVRDIAQPEHADRLLKASGSPQSNALGYFEATFVILTRDAKEKLPPLGSWGQHQMFEERAESTALDREAALKSLRC